jgi:hypothetical protein
MVALLTAPLIVPVTGGIAAARGASAVPTKLVGRWSRTVTSSDLKSAKVPPISIPTGVWSIVIKKDGSFDAYRRAASASGFTDRLTATLAGRLTIEMPFCAGGFNPNVYRWRAAGRRLTITKVSDKCGERVAIFPGAWNRK